MRFISNCQPPNEDILRFDPTLDRLVPRGAKVEQLTSNYERTEGPVWARGGGYLLFTALNEIIKWTPGAGFSTVVDHSFKGPTPAGVKVGPNGLTFDLQGRLIACEQGARRITRLEKDGKTTVLADHYEGKRLNSPNDVVVRRKTGEVYFTDPDNLARRNLSDPDGFFRKELNVNGVYRVTAAGRLELLIQDLPFPNGIAFSPDENKLYVANTLPEKTWWVYDVGSDGSPRNGKVLLDATNLPGTSGPDSMKVDKAGNLYAAGPGGVLIISPQGKHLGTIQVPEVASNCAWGDKDGKSLYITAPPGLYKIRLSVGGTMP
ncbi:MAG: SMP-30/gluconolactonase/LRE family protein [Bryobacteraceae bacterium]